MISGELVTTDIVSDLLSHTEKATFVPFIPPNQTKGHAPPPIDKDMHFLRLYGAEDFGKALENRDRWGIPDVTRRRLDEDELREDGALSSALPFPFRRQTQTSQVC